MERLFSNCVSNTFIFTHSLAPFIHTVFSTVLARTLQACTPRVSVQMLSLQSRLERGLFPRARRAGLNLHGIITRTLQHLGWDSVSFKQLRCDECYNKKPGVSTKLSISVEIPRPAPKPINIRLYAPNLQVWRAGQSADNLLVSRAGTTLRRWLQRGTPERHAKSERLARTCKRGYSFCSLTTGLQPLSVISPWNEIYIFHFQFTATSIFLKAIQ
jgi:hypothetical protein